MTVVPYYADEAVTLYLGDCREILPELGVQADCMVADPPYGETSLPWDRWPSGWLTAAAAVTRSLWCFGSLRMYLDRGGDFRVARWKLSQDIIWEKSNGSGLHDDRFRRVHEQPTHWYRGEWGRIYHAAPREAFHGKRTDHLARRDKSATHGANGNLTGYVDDGTRIRTSVIRVPGMWKRGAVHPSQKPIGILEPLIAYACPPGALVVDPFAGSGSTLDAARRTGRRAIGIEAHEPYAEAAAKRFCQGILAVTEGTACPHCGCDPSDHTTLGTHGGAACPLPQCECSDPGEFEWGTFYPDPYNPHEAKP